MSAPDIDHAPATETIWQGIEVWLTYVAGDPWPYALAMGKTAEVFVMLDTSELVALRDAIDEHLAQLAEVPHGS